MNGETKKQNKTGIALHTDFKRNYSLRGRMDTDLRTYQAILHFSHNQFLANLGGFLCLPSLIYHSLKVHKTTEIFCFKSISVLFFFVGIISLEVVEVFFIF